MELFKGQKVTCGIAYGSSVVGNCEVSGQHHPVLTGAVGNVASALQRLCALYEESCLTTHVEAKELETQWRLQWLDIVQVLGPVVNVLSKAYLPHNR